MHQVRFSIGSSDYDYLVDELKVGIQTEGSEYTYLDDSVEVEVRRVRVDFDLRGAFEQVTSGALTGVQLWFELLKGTAVTFYPAGTAGPSVSVVPVLRHSPTVYSLKSGMKLRRNSLRLAENEWRAPNASHFDDFKTLIPNL